MLQCCCSINRNMESARHDKGRRRRAALQACRTASGVHRFEEFRVVLGVAQFVEQEVDRVHGAHRIEDPAQHVHFLQEMSIAGKVRLSETLRSRISSELPVPLNSSKITSSMRLPVSTSAVAMMVSEPPSSILRAAPKKRFGRCSALASTPPVSTLPDDGTTVL